MDETCPHVCIEKGMDEFITAFTADFYIESITKMGLIYCT